MNKPFFIAISYVGTKPTDASIATIMSALDHCINIGDSINIEVLDESEIGKIITSHVLNETKVDRKVLDADEVVKKAVFIIGKRFADNLVGSEKSTEDFFMNLSLAVLHAKLTNSDDELINAIRVLKNHRPEFIKIPASFRSKYGITDSVYHKICKVCAMV